MALVNQSSNEVISGPDARLYSELKQIFPNHRETVIRRVIANLSADSNGSSLLPKCIDALVNISPSSEWNDGNNRSSKKSKLSPVQEDVVKRLQAMFPHVRGKLIQTSVKHPSNTFEPLSVPTLLQRCIDDLLEERTFLEAYFCSDDEEESDENDSFDEVKNQRMTSSANSGFKLAQPKFSYKPPDVSAVGVIAGTGKQMNQVLDISRPLTTEESKFTTELTLSAVSQSASVEADIDDQNKAKPPAQTKIYISDSKTDNTVQNDEPCKVSSAGKLRQERFSCIEFSDSDSEESKPSSDKTDSEDDLPQICVKTRDRLQSPLSTGLSGIFGRQYLSPSHFPAPVSTNTLTNPVIRSIFPTSTTSLVNGKPIVTSVLSTTQSSYTISQKSGISGRHMGAGDATIFEQNSSIELSPTSEGLSSTLLSKSTSVPLIETPGRKPETTLTSTLSGSIQQTKTETNKEDQTRTIKTGMNYNDVAPLPSIFEEQKLPVLGRATVTSKGSNPSIEVPIGKPAPSGSGAVSSNSSSTSSGIYSSIFPNSQTAGYTSVKTTAGSSSHLLHRMGTSAAKTSLTANLSNGLSTSTHTATSGSGLPTSTHTETSISGPPTSTHTATSSSGPSTSVYTPAWRSSLSMSNHTAPSSSGPLTANPTASSGSGPSTSIYTSARRSGPSTANHTATSSSGPSTSYHTAPSSSGPAMSNHTAPSSSGPARSNYTPASSSGPSMPNHTHAWRSGPSASNHTATSRNGPSTSTNPPLWENPFQNFFSNKDWDFPWNAGSADPFSSFRRGSSRDPIVIKEVPKSCMQGTSVPENKGAQVTLQNTIPLHPPADDNTTVTIESLHRITYNGKSTGKQAAPDGNSNIARQTENTAETIPGARQAEHTGNKTNTSVIELTDESSNDSVLSLGAGDVIFDGHYQLPGQAIGRNDSPMDVDKYDPGVVVIEDSPILPLNVDNTPPVPHDDFPYDYNAAANYRPHKKHRHRRRRSRHKDRYIPPVPWVGGNPTDPPLPKAPGSERAVDVDSPTAAWNVTANIKDDVLALFPDADVAHIEMLCASHSGPMALNTICNIMLESDYPKKKPDNNKLPEATATAPTEVTVDYFKDYKSMVIPTISLRMYQHQAYTLLSNDFSWISGKDIKKVMALFNSYYAPSYQELALIWKQAKEAAKLKQTKPEAAPKYCGLVFTAELETGDGKKTMKIQLLRNRRQVLATQTAIMPELRKELDFVKIRLAELAKEADYEVAKQLNEQEYEEEGQCIECGCCYGEFPFESMVQCYEGHLFCRDCLRQYAKEAVYGQGKADMKCMTDMCESNFPKSQLEKALPSEVLAKYEDRVQEENINLADLGDLVRCPHCDYAALMDNPEDKVFGCLKCGKATCRHCKEDWGEHFGKRCEEIEKKDETKLRLAYEERMTKAKVRTCHKCKAQFTKEDGCNKMTCRCGAKMCYICRKPDIEYTHFCRHPRDPGKDCTSCKACSLWTNPEEDDNRAVREIQKEAIQTRKEQGYTDEKLIGAPDEPPVKKAKYKH